MTDAGIIIDVVKVFVPTATAFFGGMFIAPVLAHYLYKHKMWKKTAGKQAGLGGGGTPIFNRLHGERDTGTPRMGGVIVWGSTALTVLFFGLLALMFPGTLAEKLDFLSRNQTWLPLFTLIFASLVGLADDWMVVKGGGTYAGGGMALSARIGVVAVLGAIGAWWFFFKLGVSSVYIPFWGDIDLGLLFIPFFIFVMIALFSGGVIDGIDGLSGGVMAIIFSAYAVIAFFQGQIDLAAFSATIAGATLAFLWFNIPPARFYMSETGILGLTTTLTVVAFLTNAVVALVIIAFPLIITSLSVVIQVLSKKMRNGKKVFLVAPIHHHFEAKGWPPYKVTMRFWVISLISAIIGMIIVFIG